MTISSTLHTQKDGITPLRWNSAQNPWQSLQRGSVTASIGEQHHTKIYFTCRRNNQSSYEEKKIHSCQVRIGNTTFAKIKQKKKTPNLQTTTVSKLTLHSQEEVWLGDLQGWAALKGMFSQRGKWLNHYTPPPSSPGWPTQPQIPRNGKSKAMVKCRRQL